MPLDLTDLVPIYQEAIDDIINSMGKNVTLYYPKAVETSNTPFSDPVHEDTRMPTYKETSDAPAPTETQQTEVIKALLRYVPADYSAFGPKAQFPEGVLRLKTFLTDVPKLRRCEYIIPNSDSQGVLYTRYRMVREPIPVGLQIDRYAITYWERI